MEQIQSVSDSELILMRIIWGNGGTARYAQISDTLQQQDMDWSKNTIIMLLSRLIEKGFLKTSKIGRKNEYTAIVALKQYQAMQTQKFLDREFEGDTSGLVTILLEQGLIAEREKALLLQDGEARSD